ncbi:MAG TPA: hypothetical protein VIW01_05525 [Dehalococcoidia bacterium]
MNKLPIALGSLAIAVAITFASLAVAGVFDGGSDASPGDGEGADTAALCVEGVEDCEDMVVNTDGDGDGNEDDALPPDDAAGACPEGTPDCNDTPGDEPIMPVFDVTNEGEALAVEAAYAALEQMGGPPAAEVDVTGVEIVTWNDACLGVDTPGVTCAQVVTPGYVVFLSGASGDYEFHTDLSGNAVFAPPD